MCDSRRPLHGADAGPPEAPDARQLPATRGLEPERWGLVRRYLHSKIGYVMSIGVGLVVGGLVSLQHPVAPLLVVVGAVAMLIGLIALMGEE